MMDGVDMGPIVPKANALFVPQTPTMSSELTHAILFTDTDGRARFRDEAIALSEGSPQAQLSPLAASAGYKWRMSQIGRAHV